MRILERRAKELWEDYQGLKDCIRVDEEDVIYDLLETHYL